MVGGEQMIPVSSTDRMILARLRALREDTAIAPPSKANRSSSQLAMTRSLRSPTAEASGSDMPRVRLAGCGSRRRSVKALFTLEASVTLRCGKPSNLLDHPSLLRLA